MLNCSICKTHCCGGSPVKAPVLMPFEMGRFFNYGKYTKEGAFRLNRKEDGTCVFLDENKKCKVYNERPMECRFYPYILSYKDDTLQLILHGGCPQKEEAEKMEIPPEVKSLPKQWWIKWETFST
jgi:Fe-S-cluster containining protein